MIFLKSLLSKATTWLIALAGVAISVLAVIVRRTTKENSKLLARVENAEAKVNHARVVAQESTAIIQEEQVREIEIINDLKNNRSDYDPNELFNDKDGD
jgi:hypothetical protein